MSASEKITCSENEITWSVNFEMLETSLTQACFLYTFLGCTIRR